jgi:hypothetical protein
MEKMYLALKTVSISALWGCAVIWATIATGECRGESITGVRYSDHSGATTSAGGTIRLAVGNKIHDLHYNEPVPRNFRSSVCNDIGAVWSVVVLRLSDSTLDMSSAKCTGRVDEAAHSSWLVVRNFLSSVAADPSIVPSDLFSSRWRSSPELKTQHERLGNLDVSDYLRLGKKGTCIDVVVVKRPDRTQLEAGGECFLRLQGNLVNLVFDLVRNSRTLRWEIDRITVN